MFSFRFLFGLFEQFYNFAQLHIIVQISKIIFGSHLLDNHRDQKRRNSFGPSRNNNNINSPVPEEAPSHNLNKETLLNDLIFFKTEWRLKPGGSKQT